jgi:hypothetical protein
MRVLKEIEKKYLRLIRKESYVFSKQPPIVAIIMHIMAMIVSMIMLVA